MAKKVPMPMNAELRAFFATIGKLGGKATGKTLSPKARAARARRAAQIRWSKKKG